jgi:hypothetical protein
MLVVEDGFDNLVKEFFGFRRVILAYSKSLYNITNYKFIGFGFGWYTVCFLILFLDLAG